jgi:hypothetical protein
MSAAVDLAEELLLVVRREFYRTAPEKRFFQERNLLLQAVTYPADWLKRHGAALPAAKYRVILQTVIDTIKAHGNQVRIRSFSAYFLDCVQKHMLHQGEKYYLDAKQLRPAGEIATGVIGELRAPSAEEDVVGTMVEVRRALRSKGGRKKKQGSASEGDLFAQGSVGTPTPYS